MTRGNSEIENNGYRIFGTLAVLEDVEENEVVNWHNFNQNDFYYDKNCNCYGVYADHSKKIVVLY